MGNLRKAAAVAAVAVAFLGGSLAATSGQAAAQEYHRIHNPAQGQYLTVNSPADGEPIRLESPGGDGNQMWTLRKNDDDTVTIVSQNGKCVGIAGGPEGGHAGSELVQYECNDNSTQRWRVQNDGDEVAFRNAGIQDTCMTGKAWNSPVTIEGCYDDPDPHQWWKVQ